ncbi:MAG: hypothetical protein ABIG44_00490 [Planctomycetota bacterium]
MRKPALGLLLLGGLLGATMGTFGCAPPPASEDALLYYLEIARFDGKVRRTWPAGQAYLDEVMRYRMALGRKMNLLTESIKPEALWAAGDPRWQDSAALIAHIEDLEKRLNTPAELLKSLEELKEVDALSHAELLDELAEALEAVPDGLSFARDAGRADFVRRAWDALAGGRTALERSISRAEARVREQIVLYREVLAEVEQFDSSRPGLHVLDAGLDAELNTRLTAPRTMSAAIRNDFIGYAQLRLRVLEPQVVQTDKRTERAEYELLSSERQYWRDELASLPKEVNDAALEVEKRLKTARKKLEKAAADAQAAHQAEVEFCEERLEELRDRQDTLVDRVKEVLAEADAAAAAAQTVD